MRQWEKLIIHDCEVNKSDLSKGSVCNNQGSTFGFIEPQKLSLTYKISFVFSIIFILLPHKSTINSQNIFESMK